MKNKNQLSDQEERFRRLQERDLAITSIAQGLQMRTRITFLEEENRILGIGLHHITDEHQATLNTISWKVTRPLRAIRELFNRSHR
jgi:hypothetical protein